MTNAKLNAAQGKLGEVPRPSLRACSCPFSSDDSIRSFSALFARERADVKLSGATCRSKNATSDLRAAVTLRVLTYKYCLRNGEHVAHAPSKAAWSSPFWCTRSVDLAGASWLHQ